MIEEVGREVRGMMPQFKKEPVAAPAAKKKVPVGKKAKKPAPKAAQRKK
jgi:hypothetical protein